MQEYFWGVTKFESSSVWNMKTGIIGLVLKIQLFKFVSLRFLYSFIFLFLLNFFSNIPPFSYTFVKSI